MGHTKHVETELGKTESYFRSISGGVWGAHQAAGAPYMGGGRRTVWLPIGVILCPPSGVAWRMGLGHAREGLWSPRPVQDRPFLEGKWEGQPGCVNVQGRRGSWGQRLMDR